MKRLYIIILSLIAGAFSLFAQDETRLKIITGGLLAGNNVSGFIIRGIDAPEIASDGMKSIPQLGIEGGGFIDYNVSRHFLMKFSLLGCLESAELVNGSAEDLLQTAGMEIPLLFVYRFGIGKTGTGYLGAGLFTHFILGARAIGGSDIGNPYRRVVEVDEITGEDRFAMTDSYSGAAIQACYEFPSGLQLMLGGKISITDNLNFTRPDSWHVFPYKLSFGIGYKF